MRKILLILCLAFCLSGCTTGITDNSTEQSNQLVADELQSKLDSFRAFILRDGVLDDIREAIENGHTQSELVVFYDDGDLMLPTPSLNADFKYVEGTLELGYDWDIDQYTCLYKMQSDVEYAYIRATFSSDYTCLYYSASAICGLPYIDNTSEPTSGITSETSSSSSSISSSVPEDTSSSSTSSTEVSFDQNTGGYIPPPIFTTIP